MVHSHGSSAPRLLLLLLQHLTQRRLAVVQSLQLGAEQAVRTLGVAARRHDRGTLKNGGVLRSREERETSRSDAPIFHDINSTIGPKHHKVSQLSSPHEHLLAASTG